MVLALPLGSFDRVQANFLSLLNALPFVMTSLGIELLLEKFE